MYFCLKIDLECPMNTMRGPHMIPEEEAISVPEAAASIGVTRSRANYWVKTEKLHARRSGRNYSIPDEGFLTSTPVLTLLLLNQIVEQTCQ